MSKEAELKKKLDECPAGIEGWKQFEDICTEILEYLFCPPLKKPKEQVRTLSGAFHDDKLAIEAETKVILDFGDASDDIFAVLVDPRGLKLRKDINYIDSDHDGEMGQDNYWRHLQSTAVISKYCYVHVFKKSA